MKKVVIDSDSRYADVRSAPYIDASESLAAYIHIKRFATITGIEGIRIEESRNSGVGSVLSIPMLRSLKFVDSRLSEASLVSIISETKMLDSFHYDYAFTISHYWPRFGTIVTSLRTCARSSLRYLRLRRGNQYPSTEEAKGLTFRSFLKLKEIDLDWTCLSVQPPSGPRCHSVLVQCMPAALERLTIDDPFGSSDRSDWEAILTGFEAGWQKRLPNLKEIRLQQVGSQAHAYVDGEQRRLQQAISGGTS